MKRSIGVFLLFIAAAGSAFSQARGRPVNGPAFDYEAVRLSKIATAVRITDRISLDGRLDEPGWQTAPRITDFYQWQRQGEMASEQTEARIIYDDDNLYIGLIMWDSDIGRRVVNELKEDFNFRDTDGITVLLDPLHDRRSGFTFGTNPAGAKRDGQLSNDGGQNNDFDNVWDVRIGVNEDNWVAEYMIPFKSLRFLDTPKQEWGLNLSRRLLRSNEESMWSPIPVRFSAIKISLAGTLVGIENIRQGRNLKVKPFMTAGVTQVRAGSQMRTIRSLGEFSGTQRGYDGGVDMKYGLSPSLTLDATYRTDFAQVEVDQQQVNLTRFNLFFPEKRDFFLENAGTFSIGAGGFGVNQANMLPFFSRRIGLSASGTPIPIVGGARVSGKAGQYDFGFLTMKTESLGTTPSNTYMAGRLRRNVLTRSWFGGILTNRDSTRPGDYNRVYGPDAHFVFYNKLEFDAYLLKSDTPSLNGKNQARRFSTGWRDDELIVQGEYNTVQANFNPEVGFVRRKDNTNYSGEVTWKPLLRRSEAIRNLTFGTTLDYFNGGNGKIETREEGATAGVTFENNAFINAGMTQIFDRLLAPARIQGIAIPAGDHNYRQYSVNFNSSQSEKLSGTGGVNWGEFWNGNRKSYNAGLGLKPNYRLNFSLNYSRDRIDLPAGTSIANLVGTRLIYGFSPRSFINAFLQYNGQTHELSTNIRFNITYRPLSDLYLVYNDRRDSRNGEPVERAFVVKLTNLFNF